MTDLQLAADHQHQRPPPCYTPAGPPEDVFEPLRIYELLYEEWGADAHVTASTFDAFVDAVYEALPQLNLTVVTGKQHDMLNKQTRIKGVAAKKTARSCQAAAR